MTLEPGFFLPNIQAFVRQAASHPVKSGLRLGSGSFSVLRDQWGKSVSTSSGLECDASKSWWKTESPRKRDLRNAGSCSPADIFGRFVWDVLFLLSAPANGTDLNMTQCADLRPQSQRRKCSLYRIIPHTLQGPGTRYQNDASCVGVNFLVVGRQLLL